MNNQNDTIAAVATPQGVGGIGIIRISGSCAFSVAQKIFTGKKSFDSIKSHTLNFGKIVDPSTNETVDEVLLGKMAAPNSFTREDVVEINCHGGTAVMMRILSIVVKQGARTAEAGEFTKRAFLNGRIDLAQAEAVIDLINAKTEEGSRAAVDQLEGRLSARLSGLRNRLIGLLAHIEVTVDYPEHDIEEITMTQVAEGVAGLIEELDEIGETFARGRILREGIKVVITGKPNVGKSSLLNELVGKSRSIVTEIPGTTRDIIEEYINIKGIPVNIVDTAGIRGTEDPVEKMGVQRAEKAVENADLVIMVLDASTGIEAEDAAIIEKTTGKKLIYLINKTDLTDESSLIALTEQLSSANTGKNAGENANGKVFAGAVLLGEGVERLEQEIADMFLDGKVGMNSSTLLTNIRHKGLVDKAAESLREALAACNGGMPLDCAAIDIKQAAESIGEITGESVSEAVIHEIFSRFCVGK